MISALSGKPLAARIAAYKSRRTPVSMFRKTLPAIFLCSLLLSWTTITLAAVATNVRIPVALATSIAADLFPVTVKLSEGNLFLTEPAVLYLDAGRVGMQVRIQAYDHRPAEGVAISEMGRAVISGTLGYDVETRQVLLADPRIDKLEFDQDNPATRTFLGEINKAWATQVTNPLRAAIPPHPYVLPFRNNIQNLVYDGSDIVITLAYQ